ncbi:MAG: hypothetical protein AB8H86_01750 [Polyangiales bacterium]
MNDEKTEFPTTIVRPYNIQIRQRVTSLLERVGCRFRDDHIIAVRTPDSVAVEQVVKIQNPTLLLPFHAHRDMLGQSVDGVTFFEKLIERAAHVPWRVLMPITVFGQAALGLRVSALPAELSAKIHVINVADVRDGLAQSTLTPLRAFLHAPA